MPNAILCLHDHFLLWKLFPQVVLAHAASAMAANYRLKVNEFDGCATPVLKGYPVSGKNDST